MSNRRAPALVAMAVAGLLAGCGSSKSYPNLPRPPALLNVSAAINSDRVVVSPRALGAGPVQLTFANLTAVAQQVTVASDQPGVLQEQTGPINPGNTAALKANLEPGSYSVTVAGSTILPAKIAVGPRRESSQNQLQQP
jgi:hypothetical protein